MSGVATIQRLIAELNREARRQLSAAVAEGRFDDLVQLTPVAKEIADLAARCLLNFQSAATGVDDAPVRKAQVETSDALLTSGERPIRSKPKKADFPQFLREKDELVKLGWSPREKGPYEHRVSKTGVNSVTSALASRGKAGHRFTMDAIIETINGTNCSEEMPSYQIYAVVSWLKWTGMVLQHGRQGYTVVRPQTFATSVEAAWQSLPQR